MDIHAPDRARRVREDRLAQGVMRDRYGFEVSRALSLLQTYSVNSHVNLQDAAKEFVNAGRGAR